MTHFEGQPIMEDSQLFQGADPKDRRVSHQWLCMMQN